MSRRDQSLPVTLQTFKRLFGLSGNVCAFPECNMPMVHETGTILGEACHIHGRRPSSARYLEEQSEEERRDFGNLILMCSSHNKVIDDPSNAGKYTAKLLTMWKEEHEAKHFQKPYPVSEKVVEIAVSRYREEQDLRELRGLLGWYRKNERKLKKIFEWIDPNLMNIVENPPPIRELKEIRDWFYQEGPKSYRGPQRIPWKGIRKFELLLKESMEDQGLRFRPLHVTWEDGRRAFLELDESWFKDRHGVEIDSDEAEELVHRVFNHNEFSFLYRIFERGDPAAYLYYQGSKNSQSCLTARPLKKR